MQLGMTIPLQKFLKAPKPPYGDPIDPFFCWEIHKVPDVQWSTLIAVNASNRYALVFVGMKASNWKHIPELITENLWHALSLDGYTLDQIETYLAAAGLPEITKTHGRRSVAGLNRAVEMLYWVYEEVDRSRLFQPELSRILNSELCTAANFPSKEYGYPREFFRFDMQRLGICLTE